jgi:hypothetical protein
MHKAVNTNLVSINDQSANNYELMSEQQLDATT